jgi:hypothetical protein
MKEDTRTNKPSATTGPRAWGSCLNMLFESSDIAAAIVKGDSLLRINMLRECAQSRPTHVMIVIHNMVSVKQYSRFSLRSRRLPGNNVAELIT